MAKKKTKRRKCPTPNKVGYHQGIHALRALQEILNKNDPMHRESRIYPCVCGKYHLSSKQV